MVRVKVKSRVRARIRVRILNKGHMYYEQLAPGPRRRDEITEVHWTKVDSTCSTRARGNRNL